MDQENLGLRTPTKRKSYSILSPIGNVALNDNQKQRIISESTGLVKFTLSPRQKEQLARTKDEPRTKKEDPTTKHREELRINESNEAFSIKQTLLLEYVTKQQELASLQQKTEQVKSDLAEILSKLKQYDVDANPRTNIETQFNTLKKKASSIFVPSTLDQPDFTSLKKAPDFNTLKTKASSLFTSPSKDISNFLSIPNSSPPNIQKIFSNVKNKLDQQSSEFGELTNKTSKFVNTFITNIQSNSPLKKKGQNIDDLANSSFNFDNLSKLQQVNIPTVRSSRNDIFLGDEYDQSTHDILGDGILESSNGVTNDTIYEQDEDDDYIDIDDCSLGD